MMKTRLIAIAAAIAIAGPVFAEGDAAKGESEFKKCKACHAIVADDGTEIVKGGKTGPNLYGVVGRAVATVPDFKYGDGILAVGAAGMVWDEALLAEYMKDPTVFIDTHGGSGKSKMTFKLAKHGEDVAAYLASVAK
jgi:cytochrome c